MIQKITICVLSLLLGGFIGEAIADSRHQAQQSIQGDAEGKMLATMNARSAELQNRAQTCEAKFNTVTLLVEPRTAPAGPSLPLLGGAVSLTLNDLQKSGGMNVSWAIPAQITPVSRIPGAQYVWIDNTTGKIMGTYLVRPVSQQIP